MKDLLEWTGTERVKAEALASVHDSQFPCHGKNSTLASRIRQLRRRRTHKRNKARSVDNTTLGLLVPTHTQHSMLTAKPHALNINTLRQIPDLLGCIDGIGIVGVHDARIVEDHVHAAPAILGLDHGLHVGFFGDVAADGFEAVCIGNYFLHFGEGFGEGGLGDVGHEDVGAFAGKEDGGFKADATGDLLASHCRVECRCVLPSGTGDDSILSLETTHGDD